MAFVFTVLSSSSELLKHGLRIHRPLILLYVVRFALDDEGHPVLVPLLVHHPQPVLHPLLDSTHGVPLPQQDKERTAEGAENLFVEVSHRNQNICPAPCPPP